MHPGVNLYYECPQCGNFLKNRTLRSGNWFWSIVYSDGRGIAPMCPEFPNLTKCTKCDAIFWLRKLKEIGNYKWGDQVDVKFQDAEEVAFLGIDDSLRALDLGVAETRAEVVHIRTHIWHTYNDRLRIAEHMHERVKNGISMFLDEEDEMKWKKNCLELIALTDQSETYGKFRAAELYRNLGDFETSIAILNSIDIEGGHPLKETLILECQLKNRYNVLTIQNGLGRRRIV
jgi:hypothetical protein